MIFLSGRNLYGLSTTDWRHAMEQKKILDEINYYKAQVITERLYANGMITFDEYDKLTALNRQSFSPLYADLLPKTLDKSTVLS